MDHEKTGLELDLDLLKFVVDKTNVLSSSEEMKDRLNVISVILLKENNMNV